MRKIGKQQRIKKIKSIFFSVPCIVVLGVVCSLTMNAAWDVYKKVRDTQGNAAAVAKTYDKLKDREEELMVKIRSLETPLGVEAEIREKFGLVKEGEEVVVVIDAPKEDVESENSDDPKNKTLWEKFKGWF